MAMLDAFITFFVVGAVLAIVCLNLASLLLAFAGAASWSPRCMTATRAKSAKSLL